MNKVMLVYREYPPRGYPPDEQPPAVWKFRDEYRDNREESEKELAMPAWERPCMLRDFLTNGGCNDPLAKGKGNNRR